MVAKNPKRAAKPKSSEKVTVTLWIDSDVLEWFKARGPDWEDQINEALRKYVGL